MPAHRAASAAALLLLCLVAAAATSACGQKPVPSQIPVVAPAPQAKATGAPTADQPSFGNVNGSVAASQALAAQLKAKPLNAPLPVQQAFVATATNNATNLTGGIQTVSVACHSLSSSTRRGECNVDVKIPPSHCLLSLRCRLVH